MYPEMADFNSSALATNKTNVMVQNRDHYPAPQFHAVSVALSTMIVLSNITVLALYKMNTQLRSKKNFLLASLALSDLFAGSVVLPLYLSCVQNNSSNWNVCQSSAILFRFLAISTILHIVAITLEKYFTILHPFYYKGLVRKRHLRMACTSIWITSLMVSLSSLTWFFTRNKNEVIRSDFVYFLVTGVLFFLLPLGVLIFAHIRMFHAIAESLELAKNLRRSQKTFHKEETPSNRACDLSRTSCISRNNKALCAFTLMLGTFILSWMTWYVGAIMYCLGRPLSASPKLYNVFHTLVFLPSFVNPMLYTYYKHDFRKALYSYFKQRSNRTVRTRLQASNLTIATPSSRSDFNNMQ